jgi:hypothetical protein
MRTRPGVCREYECQWLWDRNLPSTMRPDKVGTLLMDDPDSDEYHAVCEIRETVRLAQSPGLQASGHDGERGPHRRRQIGPARLAHLRRRALGRMGVSKARFAP